MTLERSTAGIDKVEHAGRAGRRIASIKTLLLWSDCRRKQSSPLPTGTGRRWAGMCRTASGWWWAGVVVWTTRTAWDLCWNGLPNACARRTQCGG